MKYLAVIFITILVLGCANQLPPSGGELDKTPPHIVETLPINGTVNYVENIIRIEFSEYVDQQSVREAIFFSPEVEGNVEYDWSGTELEISFEDGFRDSTTYIVSIGTDLFDINNRNKMSRAGMITFSTGPKIDRGEISGQVFAKKTDGVLIFAYREPADTLNPSEDKPQYISQTNLSGKYRLSGLARGEYRLFAVKDEYKDMLYNVEEDLIGCAHQAVYLTDTDSLINGINFTLAREDTSKPHLLEATMTDRNHIMLEFSELLDSSKVSPQNIVIHDTVAGKSIATNFLYRKSNKPQYISVIIDSLAADRDYLLEAKSFQDKNGNITESESVQFVSTGAPDTLRPGFPKISTEFANNEIGEDSPVINIKMNSEISITSIQKAIAVKDNKGVNIPFRINDIDDSEFNLQIMKKLRNKAKLTLIIDLKQFSDAAGNSIDSVLTKELQVFDGLNFTGASGKIESSDLNKIVLNLKSTDSKISYSYKPDTTGVFDFNKITPGKYLMWAFFDNDSNLIYTAGKPYPVRYSERIEYFPDTLNLRARWPVGDINWKLD